MRKKVQIYELFLSYLKISLFCCNIHCVPPNDEAATDMGAVPKRKAALCIGGLL